MPADPADILAEMGLANVKVSIDLHQNSITGHYVPRIALDCRCGKWGVTITLATWSSLATVSESALRHLAECEEAPRG